MLVIIGLPRILLIPHLADQLQQEIEESLQSTDVKVDVGAPWGWELLFGRLPSLDLIARNAIIDGLHIARVELHGKEIRFDPRLLWQEQELVYAEVTNVQGEIVVTEDALNELLWDVVDPDRFLSLQVSPRGVDLAGTISFWNMEWTVTVTGDLEVHHGTALRYALRDVALHDASVPSILLEVLSDNYEFIMDFGVFPYPVEIKEVFLEEQQILIEFGGL